MQIDFFQAVVESTYEGLLDEGLAERVNEVAREKMVTFNADAEDMTDGATLLVALIAVAKALVADMVDVVESRRLQI